MNKSMTEGINGQNAGEKTRQRKGMRGSPKKGFWGSCMNPSFLQGPHLCHGA